MTPLDIYEIENIGLSRLYRERDETPYTRRLRALMAKGLSEQEADERIYEEQNSMAVRGRWGH